VYNCKIDGVLYIQIPSKEKFTQSGAAALITDFRVMACVMAEGFDHNAVRCAVMLFAYTVCRLCEELELRNMRQSA
jgi:hypothetical protein